MSIVTWSTIISFLGVRLTIAFEKKKNTSRLNSIWNALGCVITAGMKKISVVSNFKLINLN